MTDSTNFLSSRTAPPSTFNLSPSFDLDSYISRYEPQSETRFQRLLHMARTCSMFIEDSKVAHDIVISAYVQIEKHLKMNSDLQRYVQIFSPTSSAVESVAMNAPTLLVTSKNSILSVPWIYDHSFITQTEAASISQRQTLEACLSTAQAHLAKDSIRICHLQLMEYYKIRGDFITALMYAFRSRDYCTTASSTIQVHLILIELLLHTRNYNQVLEYVAKTEVLKDSPMATSHRGAGGGGATSRSISSSSSSTSNTQSPMPHSSQLVTTPTTETLDESTLLSSKLLTASALVYMEQSRYSEALVKFLKLDPRFTNQYNTMVSAEDIALYGGLLALATTTSRKELYNTMLDSNSIYKERLEYVPALRDAIQHYSRSEYRPCLELLYSLRPELELDVRFHTHVNSLLEAIREKCLIQFFSPYSVVSFQALANCIGIPSVDDIESMVADLILSGKWNGVRINGSTQTLHAITSTESNRRRKQNTYQKVLQLGETFMAETQNTLLRLSCIQHGIVIKDESIANKKVGGSYYRGSSSQDDDLIASYVGTYGDSRGHDWYDESSTATTHHRVESEGDVEDEEEEDVIMIDRRL